MNAVSQNPSLGVLVIGQSPRPEVEAEIKAAVGSDVSIKLVGALDGLSRDEVDELLPNDAADTLFTRLPNGDGVTISKQAVVHHGERQLANMTESGHRLVVVMCTGEFTAWADKYAVLFPSDVMAAFVAAAHKDGRLGIFTPLPDQVDKTEGRWRGAGYDAVVVALSPNATAAEIEAAGKEMSIKGPTTLVFDCISYRATTKRQLCDMIGAPGILGVTAAARMAAELLV